MFALTIMAQVFERPCVSVQAKNINSAAMSFMQLTQQLTQDLRNMKSRYETFMVAEPVKGSTADEDEVIDLDDDDINCLGEINMVGAVDTPQDLQRLQKKSRVASSS